MKSTANEFGDTLKRIATEYRDFVVCVPDTRSCGLEDFNSLFPGRGYNFGIAEQNLLDVAAGISSCGNKVYVATFAVFMSMRACEQIRQFICYPSQDVTLLSTHTGLQVGPDGGTHIAVEDVGIMRSIPNLSIIQPADGYAARAMAEFSIKYHNPLYVRLQRAAVPPVYNSNYVFEFNKIGVLRDYGDDVAILSTGAMVYKCLEVAEQLRDEGINATLADVSTIKPIDVEGLVRLARKCKRIVTVEDHNVIGGLGSAVAEVLSTNCPSLMYMIGIPDSFGESGTPDELYKKYNMDSASILTRIKSFLGA